MTYTHHVHTIITREGGRGGGRLYLTLALRRQSQAGLCEFKAHQVYTGSSKPAKAIRLCLKSIKTGKAQLFSEVSITLCPCVTSYIILLSDLWITSCQRLPQAWPNTKVINLIKIYTLKTTVSFFIMIFR